MFLHCSVFNENFLSKHTCGKMLCQKASDSTFQNSGYIRVTKKVMQLEQDENLKNSAVLD